MQKKIAKRTPCFTFRLVIVGQQRPWTADQLALLLVQLHQPPYRLLLHLAPLQGLRQSGQGGRPVLSSVHSPAHFDILFATQFITSVISGEGSVVRSASLKIN